MTGPDLPAVRSRTVDTSRLRIHLLEAGPVDAPTVVLVHGNVSSAVFFRDTLTALGRRWHCVAPDLRGFGFSATAVVDATRGVRDFADDLFALRSESDVLGDGPIHLLGWSLGGGVVMQYAIDHPTDVASLVLESPMSPYGFGGTSDLAGTATAPDYAGSGGGTANADMVERIENADRGTDAPTSPRNVMRGLYVAPGTAIDPQFEDDMVDGILAMATGEDNYPGDALTSPNWPGVAPGTRGVNNAISPKYLDLSPFAVIEPQPPVLWIRGDSDQIVADESPLDFGVLGAAGIVPGWPGADVYPAQPMVGQLRAVLDDYAERGGRYTEHVMIGVAHSPHLERVDEFTQLVDTFLP